METVFMKLFEMGIQAAMVILVVFVCRAILNLIRTPKKYTYLLWLIPFLRLICPWEIESDFSLLPDLGRNQMIQIEGIGFATIEAGNEQGGGYWENDILSEGDLTVSGYIGSGVPVGSYIQQADDNQSGKDTQSDSALTSIEMHQEYIYWEYKNLGLHLERGVVRGLAFAWIVGMISILGYSLLSYVRFRRRLIESTKILEISEGKEIYTSDCISTPFVCGVLDPHIYLPIGLEGEKKEYVLAHERLHIKRLDYLVKPIAFLIVCVHWFNPMAWLAYHFMAKDMEMSCDEAVCRDMGDKERKEYAKTLLAITVGEQRLAGTFLAFGEKDTRKRVKNIIKMKKPVWIISALAIVLIAGISIAFLTNPRKSETTNEQDWMEQEMEEEQGEIESDGQETEETKDFALQPGRYYMEVPEGIQYICIPCLLIEDESSFSFSYDPFSSYLAFGWYGIKDDILTAKTGDGLYEYHFSVSEDGELTFLEEESSKVISSHTVGIVPVTDGARFIRQDNWEEFEENMISYGVDADSVAGTEVTVVQPHVTLDSPNGADPMSLDFANEDLVILHGYQGLFVYSKSEEKLIAALDLDYIGCSYTQGDYYCDVTVSEDGSTVYLHAMTSDIRYEYNVYENRLFCKAYNPSEGELGVRLTLKLEDYVERDFTVYQSTYCAEITSDGETVYGYLQSGSGLWRDIAYVEGDQYFPIFEDGVIVQ